MAKRRVDPGQEDGGDNIRGTIGDNARGAAIGKNIFQNIIVVGSVRIPVLPVLILIALVIGTIVFFGLRLVGPEQMSGSFNLAVAEFGQLDASGKIVSSAAGAQVSQRLFEGLRIELEELPAADRANFRPQAWHDSLDLTQKRAKIGMIPGDNPQARWEAACALAERINAHVMIYGNLPASASTDGFTPEFAICENPALRVDADEIVGAHQLIEALPAQLLGQIDRPDSGLAVNIRVNGWTRALARLSMGILYDLQGRSDLALATFQQAREQASPGAEPAGEALAFFIGRQELILSARTAGSPADDPARLARLERARLAFEQAIQLNPAYARAHLGLGGVFFSLAQDTPAARRLEGPDLGSALQEYQRALAAAPGSPGALIETKARLGLASAWILEGEAQREMGQLSQAGEPFERAIQAALEAVAPLTSAKQYRVLAQAYLTLGEAYHQQGHLRLLVGDERASRESFRQASQQYGLCIAQKEAAITDQTLAEKIVGGLCVPYKRLADASLAELGGPP